MPKSTLVSDLATAACLLPACIASTTPRMTASPHATMFATFPALPGYPPPAACMRGIAHTERTPTPAAPIAISNISGCAERSGNARS